MTGAARPGEGVPRRVEGAGNGDGRRPPVEGGGATAPGADAGARVDPALFEEVAADGWSLRHLERAYILHVLRRHDGHRGNTAEALGIDRRTLYRKLRTMGVDA